MVSNTKTLAFFLPLFLAMSIICSCARSPEESSELVDIAFTPEGKIKMQEILLDEEDSSTLRLFYNTNGDLTATYERKRGVYEGLAIEFYPSGRLEATSKFSQNVREGVAHTFYESGEIKSEGYYAEGKPIGEWFDYHRNGCLSRYMFYCTPGEGMYKATYDSTGNLLKTEGLNLLLLSSTEDTLYSKGEEVIIRILVPFPPEFEASLRVEVVDVYGSTVHQQVYDSEEIRDDHVVEYQFPTENPGSYKLTAHYDLTSPFIEVGGREIVAETAHVVEFSSPELDEK